MPGDYARYYYNTMYYIYHSSLRDRIRTLCTIYVPNIVYSYILVTADDIGLLIFIKRLKKIIATAFNGFRIDNS